MNPSRIARSSIVAIVAVLVACIGGGLAVALPMLPFSHQQARTRWEEQKPRHYEIDVTWARGWSFGHAQVEMHDGQLVRAVDLDTGQPLGPSKRSDAGYFASVDNLFAVIDQRLQSDWYWRVQLQMNYPQLAHRLYKCVAPLSDVTYDAQYGYPTDMTYNDGWCANTFFTYTNVKLSRLRPLP
ncbi:MAG TPA: DUF6174 domain-containing protein [Roseiflexaceae bacterium]|nr:DUF6174 domain-containing protein [Roseiflexaceae bacterium]